MIQTGKTKTIDFEVQERVNYHVGQLLRAEDFQTEQGYLVERDDRHQRMLHGYGTVFGLEVSIEKPFEQIDEITVHEGVGIDRQGRVFVVHQPQCARNIVEWWQANKQPSAIYVVAKYDKHAISPVLLAGQPCDDSVEATVMSRLRDSMALELWDHKPEMPIFEASRCMKQLLGRVSLDANADGSGKTALVSALEDICNMEGWQAQYRVTLKEFDEVLDYWVTYVMPALHGADHNNDDFPWVLLAEFHLARSDTPKLTKGMAQAKAPVRPLLLHTQLFQPPPGIGSGAPARAHPLVTVTPGFDEKNRALELELWFHLDTAGTQQAVGFDAVPQIKVFKETTDGSQLESLPFNPPESAARSNVFVYTMQPDKAASTETGYLRILIPVDTQVKGADGKLATLANHMRANGILFEGYQPDDAAFVTYVRATIPAEPSLGRARSSS